MIEMVAYDSSHLEKITLRECFKGEKIIGILGDAVTFLHDSKPIAIIGGSSIASKTYRAWSILSDDICKCPILFHKEVIRLMTDFFALGLYHRLEITVKCGYTKGWDWAKSLGFECEGILRQYGHDKSDHWIFSRLA